MTRFYVCQFAPCLFWCEGDAELLNAHYVKEHKAVLPRSSHGEAVVAPENGLPDATKSP